MEECPSGAACRLGGVVVGRDGSGRADSGGQRNSKTQGEIRKLRTERDEAHYSHRQANYHNLLNAERRMHAVGRQQENPGGPAGWIALKDRFRDCVNGVIISGSDDAVAAARALDRAYFGASEDAGESFAPKSVDWEARTTTLREFTETVRADLGAPGARRV